MSQILIFQSLFLVSEKQSFENASGLSLSHLKIKMQILWNIHIGNVWVMLWEMIVQSTFIWANYLLPNSPYCMIYLWWETERENWSLFSSVSTDKCKQSVLFVPTHLDLALPWFSCEVTLCSVYIEMAVKPFDATLRRLLSLEKIVSKSVVRHKSHFSFQLSKKKDLHYHILVPFFLNQLTKWEVLSFHALNICASLE